MLHSLYKNNFIVKRKLYKMAEEEEQGILAKVQEDIDTFLANRSDFIERLSDHICFYNRHHEVGFTSDMRKQAEKVIAHILMDCSNHAPIIVSDQFYSTSTDSGMDDSPVQQEQEHGEPAVIAQSIDDGSESRDANLQPELSHEHELALAGPSGTVSKGVEKEMAVPRVNEPDAVYHEQGLKRQHDALSPAENVEDISPTTKRRKETDNKDAVEERSHQGDVSIIPDDIVEPKPSPSQVVVQCREEQIHEPAGPRSVSVHLDDVLPPVNVEEVPPVPVARFLRNSEIVNFANRVRRVLEQKLHYCNTQTQYLLASQLAKAVNYPDEEQRQFRLL